MSDLLAKRQTLQGLGGSNGAAFENQETIVKDTFFIPPSTILSEMRFFDSDSKDAMWKDRDFPSNTQAYNITHVITDSKIVFDADAVKNALKMDYYLRNSRLEIRSEGNDVVKLPLYETAEFKIVPTTQNDVNTGVINRYNEYYPKFNNAYAFQKPIVVAAGERPDVKIIPALNLTTAVYNSSYAPFITKSTLDNDQGYYVSVNFKGIKSKANK